MPLRTLLELVLCNLIWSANPAMGKLVLLGVPAPQAAWLRYFSALVAYAIGVAVLRTPAPYLVTRGERGFRDGALLLVLGFSAFCFSPLLQMSGLAASSALDNSLIIAMEPLMTVFLAWLILRERISRASAIAFAVALGGFALLSGITPERVSRGWDSHLVGNLALLVSLLGEAVYSLAGRTLIGRYAPTAVFGSALAIGVAFLTGATVFLGGLPTLGELARMPWQSWIGVFWLGPLGTAFSYLLWMMALRQAPVASLALTLFIQPVLGAALPFCLRLILGPEWGAVFLGQGMSVLQGLGCLLILVAVFGQTLVEQRARRAA